MARSIVLAGGGTAGHVNPLVAVAQEIKNRYPDATITILGTAEGLEADLVPAKGFELTVIPRVPLPRQPSLDWFRLPGKLRAARRGAFEAIATTKAQVVVGFGGYVSTPAYLAARKLGVPMVVQEQNARPGLANKLGARWAARIATTFPETKLPGATVTGLPLREDVAALIAEQRTDRVGLRQRAAATLGLDPDRPVLLITGGSLGALKINQTMAQVAQEILAEGAQMLHLTGRGKSEQVLADIAHLPEQARADYHVREYLDQMHLAYAVADLVVCRSGAGTVCELAALGLPAVFVPLPIGNGEQKLNASGLTDAQAALIVDNEAFTPQWASSAIVPLLTNRDELERMAQAAVKVGRPRATQDVVDIIEQVAGWTRD